MDQLHKTHVVSLLAQKKNPFPSLMFENQVNLNGIWRNWAQLSLIFSSLDRLVFKIANLKLLIVCSDSA